jgi:glutaredoxin
VSDGEQEQPQPQQPQQSQPQQHASGLDMSGLVLFGMPGCGGCVQSAQWLSDQGHHFTKYDVTTSPRIIQWLVQTTGQRTVPQFFLNGHWLREGFPRVQHMAQLGELPRPRVTQL